MDNSYHMNDYSSVCCPFPSPSGEAVGQWFIGRRDIIQTLVNDLAQINERKINYSIVGLPRIGKSSLMKVLIKNQELLSRCPKLVVCYISLDQCHDSSDMWSQIARALSRSLKQRIAGRESDFKGLKDELQYFDLTLDLKRSEMDYEYLSDLARCMKACELNALIFIDEFDRFSEIADKTSVGNLRTLLNGSEYGICAVTASRRELWRIENDVEKAVDSNTSTLKGIFNLVVDLKPFDKTEIEEYWQAASQRLGYTVSGSYMRAIKTYVGNHPLLLNKLNWQIWSAWASRTESAEPEYLWDGSVPEIDKYVNSIHEDFNTHIWKEIEKWDLHNTLILHTWGPSFDINQDKKTELMKYGVIDEAPCLKPMGPQHVAISLYFTEWMGIKRYMLPFTDSWSVAERNMRNLIRHYCNSLYQGDEKKMIDHINSKASKFEKGCKVEFTSISRFNGMKTRRDKNLREYPYMSNYITDYSMPKDFPEIFFRRDWQWFGQVFGGDWDMWRDKFDLIGDIRNLKLHNNEGVPIDRINLAKKHCHEMNILIEKFLLEHAAESI